jgi:TatD DNase family protein
MFFDTHTHLFLSQFDADRNEVVRRAIEAGVYRMMLPNVDGETIEGMLALAGRFPDNCYPSIGLHPASIDSNYQATIDLVGSMLDKHRFYAIGETGIDLYRDKSNLSLQVDAFRQQVTLALRHQLPLIIHCRDSFGEIMEVIHDMNTDRLTGIFHSFTGSIDQAGEITGAGFMIGLGGILTFRNAGLDRVVDKIALEHIVLETDAPYLSPVPFRGKRNEPAYLVHTARRLAELHGRPLEDVAGITTRNALTLFGINH